MAPATPRKVSAAVKGTNSTRSVKCAERTSLSAPYLCIVPLNVVVVPSAVKSAIDVELILLELAACAVEDSGKSDRCARIPGVVRVGLEQRYIVLDVVGHRVDARCFDKVHAGQVCIASLCVGVRRPFRIVWHPPFNSATSLTPRRSLALLDRFSLRWRPCTTKACTIATFALITFCSMMWAAWC